MNATEITFMKIGRKYMTADTRFIVGRETGGWFMLDRTTRNEYFVGDRKVDALPTASEIIAEIVTPAVRTIRADMIWTHKYDERYGDNSSCQCCGRKVSDNAVGIVVVDGGYSIIHPDDIPTVINDGGYMGWYPIGSECARKIPAEYLTR